MSERTYFSLRYAVPGYTFILLVIGINYIPLWEILKRSGIESTFGAFLAFLSLLGGSAFGFLVSQFWWWLFQKNFGVYERKPVKALIDRYKLTKSPKSKPKKGVLAVYGYIIHSKREKGVHIYTERRWDIYHLLSSELYTLLIGAVLGLICRVFLEVFLFKVYFSFTFHDFFSFLKYSEFWVLLFIFVSVVFLLFLLQRGRDWVITEYDALSEAAIKESKVTKAKLREIFPPDFFDLTIIKGIGDRRAEKFEKEGIYSVSELAESDPKELSQKIGISEETVSKLIDQAKEMCA